MLEHVAKVDLFGLVELSLLGESAAVAEILARLAQQGAKVELGRSQIVLDLARTRATLLRRVARRDQAVCALRLMQLMAIRMVI